MTTPKQSPKPADDVAAMVERLRSWDHCWPAPWLETAVSEAAAMLTRQAELVKKLEAERDGYRDRAHYAEGTASLAIQHRDAAEKRIADLEAERDRIEGHYDTAQANWDLTLDRAEAAEKRNAELEAFVKLCADGFFIADDELQGAAMATLKEKNDDK